MRTSVWPSTAASEAACACFARSSPRDCTGDGYRRPSAFLHVVFPLLLVGVAIVIASSFRKGKFHQTATDNPAVSDRVSFSLANVHTGANCSFRRVSSDGRRSRWWEGASARCCIRCTWHSAEVTWIPARLYCFSAAGFAVAVGRGAVRCTRNSQRRKTENLSPRSTWFRDVVSSRRCKTIRKRHDVYSSELDGPKDAQAVSVSNSALC